MEKNFSQHELWMLVQKLPLGERIGINANTPIQTLRRFVKAKKLLHPVERRFKPKKKK